MLKQMRLTDRQKRGDVQHLLARSFSRKGFTNTALSPSGDVSIPVPQIFRQATLPPQEAPVDGDALDSVSIGELSIEPRVIGPSDSNLASVTSPQSQTTSVSVTLEDPAIVDSVSLNQSNIVFQVPSVPRLSPPPSSLHRQSSPPPPDTVEIENVGPEEPPRRTRKDSLSSSESDSCPEEQSVRTPLLETQPAPAVTTLPTNSVPSIKKYDEMFAPQTVEEEIPLGGSAENLRNQP